MFPDSVGDSRNKGGANVKVVVRLRPPNEAEHNDRYRTVTHAISDHMLVFDPKVQSTPGLLQAKPRDITRHRYRDLKYAFDYVFGPCATNKDVFEQTTKGVVSGVLNGYNCSVFAYGATGAGKTHTMLGNDNEPGVIYFTMMDLYSRIDQQKQDKVFDVAVSYSEVYNEQVRDLLIPRGNLPIREDKKVGVIIAGLSLHKPKSAEELLHMLQFGNKNRTQHPTDANAESSRSHAVFQVFVNQRDKLANGSTKVVMAKMCLVDLAGSERAHRTTNCGNRFREGANINRSLLALGNVINALADNRFKGHIPYRDSKLTRLLKDSLGGNCRTVMIAAVSPSSRSFEDTYNTLRYADRAKHIRANIKQNVMSVDFHMTNYKKYVQELEKQNQELKQEKQKLLESLEKSDGGYGQQGNSPIVRQFQERLKDLFKARRDIRKIQMESEEARRELKWKVSRREQAIKRVQLLTGSTTVVSKHCRVIERMKKRIEKEEHALKDSDVRLQKQDKAICQTIAEFSATDSRQTTELLDLNMRTCIGESNLYDSDMYLAFVKKLARAQERQVTVTEGLVSCLIQLVKRQHDVLHSQDLLSPELQHKYEQCCCLVEERGVAFTQQATSDSPQQHKGDVSGSVGSVGGAALSSLDTATAVAAASSAAGQLAEESVSVSDIIDIKIPRLRVQGLIQQVTQSKPQEPQRVLKPVSAVRPAARITSTQMQEFDAPQSALPPRQTVAATPHHPGLVSQGTFSRPQAAHPSTAVTVDQSGMVSSSTPLDLRNPIDLLNHSLDNCPRQGTSNLARPSPRIGLVQASRVLLPMTSSTAGPCDSSSGTTDQHQTLQTSRLPAYNSIHHQFPSCAPMCPLRPNSPPPPSEPPPTCGTPTADQQVKVRHCEVTHCSPEVNSSTENLSNTFEVLKPPMPNTPCIDCKPQQRNNNNQTRRQSLLTTTSSTPLCKRLQPLMLNGITAVVTGADIQNHPREDKRGQTQDRVANPVNVTQSLGTSFKTPSKQSRSVTNVTAPSNTMTPHLPSSHGLNTCTKSQIQCASTPSKSVLQAASDVHRPRGIGTNTNNGNSAAGSSPKSYAEALKSPPVCHTPVSGLPARIRVTPCQKNPAMQQSTMITPDFSSCLLKQRLQLTCEKPPARVELDKSGIVTKPAGRRPLRQMDSNTKPKPSNVKDTHSISTPTSSATLVATISMPDPLPYPEPPADRQLQLKSKPVWGKERRLFRIQASSSPYSVQSPRRARRWQSALKAGPKRELRALGPADNVPCGRPSYMQPTFSRAQKMMPGNMENAPPQRQAGNPPLNRQTFLHKPRFVLS